MLNSHDTPPNPPHSGEKLLVWELITAHCSLDFKNELGQTPLEYAKSLSGMGQECPLALASIFFLLPTNTKPQTQTIS